MLRCSLHESSGFAFVLRWCLLLSARLCLLRFLKGGCESIYIKFSYNCVNFNSARLGVEFSDKVCLAVFLSIVISFLAGVVCFFFLFSVLHCNSCRALVFFVFIEWLSVWRRWCSFLCCYGGLLIVTVRPIPGLCLNRMSIFVLKRGSVAVPVSKLAKYVEGLLVHLVT